MLLCHGGKTRLLDFPKPLPDLAIAVLIWLTRDCLSPRRTMAIKEVSAALRDAVAASRASPEAAAFNHKIEPDADRQNELAGDGSSAAFQDGSLPQVCDLRGYPVGAGDRAGGLVGMLDHADAIDFLTGPDRCQRGHPIALLSHDHDGKPQQRACDNNPFETLELDHVITLIRRAMSDRQVVSPVMLDDVQFAALAAAWLNVRSVNLGDDPGR